jgi:3D (Asp-Asp-Asp) domain-containing protein
VELSLRGEKKRVVEGPVDGRLLGVFRNTYYDFPAETEFSGSPTPLMNRACKPISQVPRSFYEAVCVQGSGTLVRGTTVSFAKRDCACAEICPRTGQKICFDELDPQKFPWGRGAQGSAITPLRTIAVDSDVIPLGTRVYIPEFDGISRSPGNPARHDGCFIAQDRGMKVVGQHVDVFTGNPRVTEHFNTEVPSNQGVHVYLDTARCNSARM